MRVICRARIRTDERADKGLSLAAPRAKVEDCCRLCDLELVEVIEDAGQSGKTLKREGCNGRSRCSARARPTAS
jgi:hypothetical protein